MFAELVTKVNILFTLGCAGLAHELFIQEVERPWILAACTTMVGLKPVLSLDEKRKAAK